MSEQVENVPVGPIQAIEGNVIHVHWAASDPQSASDQALIQSASHAASIASLMTRLAIELEHWAEANPITNELANIVASTKAFAATTEHMSSTIASIPRGNAGQV